MGFKFSKECMIGIVVFDIFLGINLFSPMGTKEDRFCWRLAKSQGFAIKCYYRSLSSIAAMIFPWKSI
jgi:hypothetical protein